MGGIAGTGGAAGGTGGAVSEICGRIRCDCTLNGKNLWGKVQFVTSTDIRDFDVELTSNLSDVDLKVQDVGTTGFPTSCGKWQTVTSLPDIRVYRYTTPLASTDFKIVMDQFNPGVVKQPNN
jgi:hypothetical protein